MLENFIFYLGIVVLIVLLVLAIERKSKIIVPAQKQLIEIALRLDLEYFERAESSTENLR